jgi:hypothetical protein
MHGRAKDKQACHKSGRLSGCQSVSIKYGKLGPMHAVVLLLLVLLLLLFMLFGVPFPSVELPTWTELCLHHGESSLFPISKLILL